MSATTAREPRESSGLTTALILAYVEREKDASAVADLLDRAGMTGREPELRDERRWFSFKTKVALMEAAGAVLEDPDVGRHIGAAALDLGIGGSLKVALRTFGTPRLVYANIVRANARFSASHRMQLDELGARTARLRWVDLAGHGIHPLDCQYNQGLLATIPALFGLPPARIEHTTCAVHGAESCVYDASWESRVLHPARLAGQAVVVAGASGAGAALFPPVAPLLAVLAFVGGSLLTHRAARSGSASRRQLAAHAAEQREISESLQASLRDLVSDLDLDEVLNKIVAHANVAVRGREYVLVLQEQDGGASTHASARLPAATLATVAAWAAHTRDDPSASLMVDDVTCDSALRELGDASLCAAPLELRGERLGVLVAFGDGRDAFLPQDAQLLESYAAQAAIAIDNARTLRRMQELASRDALTGLFNHREFHETVGRELARCRRSGERFSVLIADLDRFKALNDRDGHLAGDRALRQVAACITATCRETDSAFRIGGDEFAIVLPGTARDDAEAMGRRLKAAVEATRLGVGLTSGCACWPQDADAKTELLTCADQRMYRAKPAATRTPGSVVRL